MALIRPKEACDRLRITHPTLYRYIEKGIVRATKIDGVLRIYEESIDEAEEYGRGHVLADQISALLPRYTGPLDIVAFVNWLRSGRHESDS